MTKSDNQSFQIVLGVVLLCVAAIILALGNNYIHNDRQQRLIEALKKEKICPQQ